MKFAWLFKHTKETEDFFKRYAGKKFGEGVYLARLDDVKIADALTGEIKYSLYAFRFKTSLLNYLRFKRKWSDKEFFLGWKQF